MKTSQHKTLTLKKTLSVFIALVWLVNGLFCKLLNMVPRHQMIVSRILGDEYAWLLTKTIGFLELLMVVWILSGIKSRLCTLAQILVIFTMVSIEISLIPELLLFGSANAIPALFFIIIIYLNEFKGNQLFKNKSASNL